jgi:hypothetical protein
VGICDGTGTTALEYAESRAERPSARTRAILTEVCAFAYVVAAVQICFSFLILPCNVRVVYGVTLKQFLPSVCLNPIKIT